jgi:hypothetical protein
MSFRKGCMSNPFLVEVPYNVKSILNSVFGVTTQFEFFAVEKVGRVQKLARCFILVNLVFSFFNCCQGEFPLGVEQNLFSCQRYNQTKVDNGLHENVLDPPLREF